MSKVTVLGCGSWGTALAIVLAQKGQPVTMWCRREEQAAEMNNEHENKKYLPGVTLPEGIHVTNDVADALNDTDFVVLAVPSQTLRDNLNNIKEYLPEKAVW